MVLKPPGRGTTPSSQSRASSTRSRGRGRGSSGTGSASASEYESMTGIETSNPARGSARGASRGTTPRAGSLTRGAARGGAPFRGAKSVRFANGVAMSSPGSNSGSGAGNAANTGPGHGPQAGGFSAPIDRQQSSAQTTSFGASANTGFGTSNEFGGSGFGGCQTSPPHNSTGGFTWSNDQVPAGFGMGNNNKSSSGTSASTGFSTGFGGSALGQNSNSTGFGTGSSGFGTTNSNGLGTGFGSSKNGFGTVQSPADSKGVGATINGINERPHTFASGRGKSVDFDPGSSRKYPLSTDPPTVPSTGSSSHSAGFPKLQSQPSTSSQSQARSQRFNQGGNHHDRYQALKKRREQERLDAIANGFLADPNRPRSLAEAITPVGTCQDLCAEFERLERIVQNDVWEAEKDHNDASNSNKAQPDETRMVKKFRRAAAGLDEQLPSDLRPPGVLQRTCDYLFDTLLSDFPSLIRYHHFIWDRTRAIRNDFSIQQLFKAVDVRIGIDCYERIARFHILSLHLFSYASKPYERYDAQQEREQLDKTLLSLMQYYDDSRGRVQSPNEAEFRAYCIIFQIQDPVPDLEDRVQSWPREIITDPRVRVALEIYAAACNTNDPEGPMRPKSTHPVAQANWARFWTLIKSKKCSYLTSCVAEMYFNLVRQTAMQSIWIAYRSGGKKKEDWTIPDLVPALGFDGMDEPEEATVSFLESYGFTIGETGEGQQYVDLSSLSGRQLPDPSRGMWKQGFNWMFEWKRTGRSLSALILGMSVKRAREKGMVEQETARNKIMSGQQQQESEGLFWTDADDKPKEVQQQQDAPSTAMPSQQEQQRAQQSEPPKTPFSFAAASSTPSATAPKKPLFGFGSQQPAASEQAPPKPSAPSFNPFQSQPNTKPFQSGQQSSQSNPFAISTTPPAAPQPLSAIANPFSSQPSKPEPYKSQTSNPFANLSSTVSKAPTFDFPKPNNHANPRTPSSQVPKPQSDPSPTFTPSATQDQSAPETSRKPSFSSYKDPFAPSKPSPLGKQPPFAPQSGDPSPASPSAASVSQQPATGAFTFTPQQAKAPPIPSTSSPLSQPAQPSRPSGLSSTEQESQRTRKELGEAGQRQARDSETLSQLSRELVLGPYGFLEQYIELTAPNVISQVREKVQLRKDVELADEFRLRKIMERYGLKWHDICWKKRLQVQGRARRQRMRAHREEQERRSRDNSVNATLEGFKASMHGRSTSDERQQVEGEEQARTTRVRKTTEQDAPQPDAFGNSMISIPPVSPERQRSPARRPLSLVKSGTGHRRTESAPDNSIISSLTGLRSVRGNPGLRSFRLRHSFIPKEQAPSKAAAVSNNVSFDTTRSTYFKLKAMGIDPNASSNKRPRSDSDGLLQGRPDKRSLLRHSPLSARKARDQSPVQGQPSTPAQPSSHTNTEQAKQSPINEEDEELFASVRQIREAMDDSISFFQSSVQREEDLERFRSSHGSAGSPPGMNASVNYIKPDGTRDWRAYAEQKLAASMRESQSDASASAGKRKEPPPAYRNRVSKFLSKEKYADIMMQKRRDLEQRDRGETREKYTPLRHRQVDRPVERKEEHAEEVDTSMVEMEVPRQADHVWKQQHAPAQQQRGAPEQQQQPSFSVHDDQQAASTPVKQPQRSPSQPTAAPSQQPWGSIDPALFGSSFGPETAKKAPDKQQPSTSRWVQTTSQRPQQATQIIDLGSSPPPPERSERQVSPLAQAPTTAPAVKTHERPPSRDSIFTPEASFSYGPHATSQWGADLGSSSLDPETNIGHPQVDNNHVRDAIIAPLDQPSQVEAQQTQSDTSARSRPFGFGSGMGVGPGGFDIGQTSFASTSFGQPIAGSVQQQQQNAHSSGFRGMGHVEETQRVEDSVQKPQRTASQEPITQVMATTTAQAMQAPDFILDEGGDTEPDPSRPASRAEQHQDQPRMTTERPSPPPLKRQRSSPEDMRQNAKSRPNKARKQEKPSRNISANRFDLLAALGGEADGADDDSKSVSSTAESPASQPPVRRSRSPQKQSQQQPIQISSDATIDPNDEQYQPQHPNGKDLNDGFLASQMQLHLDPQAQQAQRVLDRLSPTAIDRHRSRSRSVTPSRFAADLQSRGQSEEAPASGEDVDDHQHSAEPNGFHVREHSAASTTSPSGSASRSESRDPNDDGAYDDIAEDVNGDTEAAFDGLDDVQYDTAPSQPRDADVGFDDGLEYADDEAEEDGYGDEEDYNDGMEDDQEGLEEMEEDEVSDADEDEGEDDQPTPKPVRRPQQQQQQPQKQVLINGKSGASAEDAIEL